MGKQTIACTLIVLGLLAGCGRSAPRSGPPSLTSSIQPERELLEEMYVHDLLTQEMMQLCIQRASRAELRQFCQTGALETKRDGELVAGWLKQWYGAATPPRSRAKGHSQYGQSLSRLRQAPGNRFDEQFLFEVQQRHRQELDEACAERAVRTEMKQHCAEDTARQKEVLATVDRWFCQWFSDCVAVERR